MDFYCDVEVTGRLSFDVLSLALVSASGREFYAEYGAWENLPGLDRFASELVVSQFGRVANARADSPTQLAQRLVAFLDDEPGPLNLIVEQAGVLTVIERVLAQVPQAEGILKRVTGIDVSRQVVGPVFELAAERSYSEDVLQRFREHHALADARALRAKCVLHESMNEAAPALPARELARRFLADRGTDHKGRMLGQILAWSDEALITTHDWVQWVFPLPEPSPHNPAAPAPTLEDFAALAEDDEVRTGVARASARFLALMGLEFDGVELSRAANWPARCGTWAPWATSLDRNISRMLRSASLLGFRPGATRVLEGLEPIVRQFRGAEADRVLSFWRGAVRLG